MSENNQRLYNYLNENTDFKFGTFDEFNEKLKEPKDAEKLRNYLNENTEFDFGDSTTFYNKVNAENVTQEQQLNNNFNIAITTTDSSEQILQNELNTPNSSSVALSQITNPNYETGQKIDSSDYGYFQINDKIWNDTSMSMFGKPVGDLNNAENIALASHIEKKSPLSWNNWVAFNRGRHKDFDEITDEQIVNNYGVPVDVLDSINQSFDDPITAKKVMLAESGGDSTAININYTPQEEGQETVPQETLQQSSKLINDIQNFQPQFETAEPDSTDVVTEMEKQDYPTFGLSGTQIAPFIQENVEDFGRWLTDLDDPKWESRELENLKPVFEFGVNAMSRIAELPGLAIDIPTSLIATPEEAVIGLLKFIPEEFNNLVLATGTLDALSPLMSLAGYDLSRDELNKMRTDAQKHIFDTGGVYTYFAASGLTHLGKKNSNIIEKNKEFRDVVELANDRPAMGRVTPEMQKAVETLKKNTELKEKAEVVKNNQLLTDYLEKWEVEKKVEKANVVSEQLELKLDTKPVAKKTKKQKTQKTESTEINLERDMPSPTIEINKIKKETQKIQKKVETVTKKINKEKKKQTKTSSKEVVQEIKIEKSSDLGKAKNLESIKGEPAKRYNSKEKVDAYIEKKLGEYVGQNVVANYGKLKNGNYIVKIFKKTKEQPLPITATKRTGPKIKKEASTEIVGKMRDPRSLKRRIQNENILVKKYESQISELGRSTEINLKELNKLKKQSLETGIKSPREQLLANSIDAANILIEKTQYEVQKLKTTQELMRDVVRNVSKRTAKGSVGRNAGRTTKERIEIDRMNRELARDINLLWEKGNTGAKKTKKALIDYLKENNAPKVLVNHVKDNFKELYDYTTIENAKILANEINAELPQSQGEVRGTRTATRTRDEYFDNLRVDIISGKEPNNVKLPQVNLMESLTNNIGGEKSAKAKGTRTLADIERGTKEKNNMAKVFHELKTGELSVKALPELQAGHIHTTATLLEEFAKNRNPATRELLIESLLATKSYISEPARAQRNLRDLKAEGIRNWKEYEQFFNNDATLIELMRGVYEGKEVKRSRLFKLAEWGRNMKLATGSSIIRSLAGNTMSSVDAYARMPFEFGADYLIRKTSGVLYELTNGYYGNLSPNQMSRLEIGAQFAGYHAGFRKTGNLLYDMLMENDRALRESPFFQREGFTYKDIKGKKGVVIRTPQRVQGMIDIMYRVPMTNAYMHRYAVRQAIKDGYKTKTEILQRANEIIETQSLDAKFMERARKDGEYVTFQRELKGIGAWANKLRTGNTRGAAVTQMLVPFFNTAGNLFRYTLEHTPLNVFMKDFRQGLVEAFSREGAGSRKLATEVGKISSGLGTMYLLNEFLVENAMGNLTGDWSDMFPEERNMRTVDGQQEYALKLSDGNWVSYRGFEPMSSYLTLIEALQRTEEDAYSSDENIKKYGNMVKNVTLELSKSFAENPFLAGTGDLFKAMHGRKDWLDFSFNFMAGMTVPGTYRQWLSVVDDKRRRRFKLADYDENTNYIEILESQAENVLPWFIDGDNFEALDPFGNEIPKPDPVGGLLAWRKTQPKNDPVYKEIQEIYFDQGKGFKPASAFFTSSDLAKIKLAPEEHYALIKASGQELYNFLSKIVQTEEYQKIPPAIRRKKINEMKEKYINTYRKLFFTQDLAVPSAIMKAKEISGEFQTPKDREDYLKEMRSQIPPRTVDEILNEYLQ